MKARWLSFVIWAAVGASAVFWALRLLVPALAVPAHAATVSMAAPVRSDLTPLLGGEARAATGEQEEAVAAVDSRYQLLGVVSPRGSSGAAQGLALIAVDGKPAKAYRVGASVDDDNVLQSVTARGAAIGPKGGVASVALELPALAPPATSAMPPGTVVAAPIAPRALAPTFPRPMPAPAGATPMVAPGLPAEVDSQGRLAQ